MKSKFQQNLWNLAIQYFTVTNTSLLTTSAPATSTWQVASNFLWQQYCHANDYFSGHSTDAPIYSHHGPRGLERACNLLQTFCIIPDNDTMHLLKYALNLQGNGRKLSIENVIKINAQDTHDETPTTASTTTESTLPLFTQEDIIQLLAFINADENELNSSFAQAVFTAAFRCFNLFESDIRTTQYRLDKQLAEGMLSTQSPVKHRHRADCTTLYQKIMPLKVSSSHTPPVSRSSSSQSLDMSLL